MNILIVGNGFDRAHNLPTDYKDFLEFTNQFLEFKELQDNNMVTGWSDEEDTTYMPYFCKLYNNKHQPPRYGKTIKELYECINDNLWIAYFKQVKIRDGWIDFESEISRIIQMLDDVRFRAIIEFENSNDSAVLTNYELRQLIQLIPDLKGTLFVKEIIDLKERLLDDLNKLIRCLEIYLSDYVGNLEIKTNIPFLESLEINKVLSFNYTNTYEEVYDPENLLGTEYDFIHGKADILNDTDSCNMVVGIDEYLEGDERNKDNEFIYFKKFFQRIYKGTGNKYLEWLNDAIPRPNEKYNPPATNVYIYGHSLDSTDGDILRDIILAPNTKTTIFYHNKEAFGKQIANLVKVITEDELIRRTGGMNKSIEFCDINKFRVSN